MKTKKGTIAVVAVMVVLMAIVCAGLLRDFDAQGYVRGILDQRFQGEVAQAEKMIDDTTEEELLRQYEEGVELFVEDHITNGVDVDEKLKRKYVNLCKEIFSAMKYKVHEAEKIDWKQYDVAVEFQPSDVFHRFVKGVREESDALMKKVENGEYKGTKEEINAQMQEEFLNRSYEILKESYQNMQYGDAETIVFQVKSNENHVFSADENEISLLITKILRLDEIQD